MGLFHLGFLPVLALATPILNSVSVEVRPKQTVNGTVEYTTQCKTCPYNLCTNVNVPWGGDIVTLTCWTNGELVGDARRWLKTTDNCYITEYDLIEYPGDFSVDLKHCGNTPFDITRQPAKVRYLSECKWSYSTSAESIKYYGRDVDVTLTCWAESERKIAGDAYWYKTTDNCYVSGSGLWKKPDRSGLKNCGPSPGPRINETRRSVDTDEMPPALEAREEEDHDLARRWLQPEQIGEEYAPCYSCPAAVQNSTCRVVTTYEFNNTVTSQCVTSEFRTFPNGSFTSTTWMLTTDWCYVDGVNFWVPPWDYYRYPRCNKWKGFL